MKERERQTAMENSIYRVLGFAVMGLMTCHQAAIGDEIGFDSVTGKTRAVKKTDKTLVGTKQSLDTGEVVQRNTLRITILAPTTKLNPAQFSHPEECIGKIAKIPLSSSTCIDKASVTTPRKAIKTSKAIQAVANIEAGEFVAPSKVKVIEKPIAPEKTPVEWFSNLRDVVGRKTIKATKQGEILTEAHFGPRGTIFSPEETKEFGKTE